jgi:multiple antibiotic resistance protein
VVYPPAPQQGKSQMNPAFLKSTTLLFVLLNPFLMSIYLIDLIQDLKPREFSKVLLRGTLVSTAVFMLCAVAGDQIFTAVLGARFAAFLIFGGIVFLLIGLRFVFQGSEAIRSLRGNPKHIAGSVALPFMIGPGTVSASILTRANLSLSMACASIATAMALVVVSLVLLKLLLDLIKKHNAPLLEKYIDITGRISALVIGTIAIEMLLQGVELFLRSQPK